MATLTPEEQAKVAALAARARVLYDSILQAKPGNDLAFAIRDKVPFDKLKDESIAQVATTVVLFAKGLAKLDEDAKAASDQAPPADPKSGSETPREPKADGKKK